ncbi:HYDIN [Symbiodinium sp. KB8]|nr:HYDIN [Symbiodinium sp. KB8]
MVGHKCERTVLVRNVGDRASKLLCKTTAPFRVKVEGSSVLVHRKGRGHGIWYEFETAAINETVLLPEEIWKPAQYPGIRGAIENLMVSNHGRVSHRCGGFVSYGTRMSHGYHLVVRSGKGLLVHRLVAATFMGEQELPDAEVNHKDSNRGNNHLDNLEYVTRSENMKHAWQQRSSDMRRKGIGKVVQARSVKSQEPWQDFETISKAAAHAGVPCSKVSRICKGLDCAVHLKWEFRFAPEEHFEGEEWRPVVLKDVRRPSTLAPITPTTFQVLLQQQEAMARYGEMEAVATLRGQACNAEVSLSHSLLLIEDTYVGLESQGVVTIRNDSDAPIDFSWRLFASTMEEAQHRLALHQQLKAEEMDELLFMQQANLSEDEESDSGSDGERRRLRTERKVTKLLGRKYDSIMKAVEEDPMLFRDGIFKIEPLSGRLWPHTQVTCACCFCPKDALVYCATAYLSAVGQEDRAPLVLKGLGIGPKATFSYDELDVGNVFVESAHRYEVQLLNQGDIEVDFRLVHREGKFAPRFKFTPDHGTIAVGGQCEIVVDFKPKELGQFHEVFEWALQGGMKVGAVRFEFDVDKINFGTVSFGFLNSRMLTLTNTSEVPCYYTLMVKGDEAPPSNEFEIIPSRGTLLPNCAQRIQVDFISSTEKKYDTRLSVDLEGVGKELLSIPIFAQCAVPTVSFEPHGCLNYGDVFIRYPFHQSLYLHNTSVLPAKFMVEGQPSEVGTVPPCASHVITVTLTAHTAGPLRIPMYVKIMGRDVPFPLVVRCPFRGEEGGRRRLRHWGFGWGLFRFTVTTHCSSYRAAATPSPPPPPPPPPFRHHHPSHEYTRCFNGF